MGLQKLRYRKIKAKAQETEKFHLLPTEDKQGKIEKIHETMKFTNQRTLEKVRATLLILVISLLTLNTRSKTRVMFPIHTGLTTSMAVNQ